MSENTANTANSEDVVDVLDVPDSEFLEKGEEYYEQSGEESGGSEEDVSGAASSEDSGEIVDDDTTIPDDDDGNGDLDESGETDEDAGSEGQGESEEEDDPSRDADSDSTKEESGINYEEVGKLVMAEFKANGKPMRMKSAEDIIQLMQMGANYHSKMVGLKPSLKTLKLLEKHDLLDEQKLNYLIDLNQKDPEAIKQLLKDSNIDPVDIDMESESSYQPKIRTVSDTEVELETVLTEISTSPKYAETLNILGEQWDDDSRKIVANNPGIIKDINEHLESGAYYQVAQAVTYERQLGRLQGINDFQAYKQMGEYMQANNLLNVTPPNSLLPEENPDTNAINADTGNKELHQGADSARMRRKAAASPTRKGKGGKAKKKEFNPLEMSDEEFMKLNSMAF